jgi:sulfate transport system ATP-binding protein
VLNRGRIEQVGSPTDLYDRPASEFVMRFVGDANRLGDTWVRPHELELLDVPDRGAVEAMIERITPRGFDARVDLVAADGTPLVARLTRERLEQLELERGQIVWARAERALVLAEARVWQAHVGGS